MNIIYKYPLYQSTCVIQLPFGATVLTAQNQADRPVLWALIEQDEHRMVRRTFVAINTGDSFEVPGTPQYISTITSENGIVWHIFEVLP